VQSRPLDAGCFGVGLRKIGDADRFDRAERETAPLSISW